MSIKLVKTENGITVLENNKPIEHINIKELTDEITRKLTVYGLFVKIQRSSAGLKNPADKKRAWLDTIQALKQGTWERKTDPSKVIEKAKMELISSIKDPALREKLKKELGLE